MEYIILSCSFQTSEFPSVEKVISDFVYIRFHGLSKLYASSYSIEEVGQWAEKVGNWLRRHDVYWYFTILMAMHLKMPNNLKYLLRKKDIERLQQDILTWYRVHKRDLPWRNTRNPYNILISEVMSQQTQIQRVIPKYLEWMEVFPTLEKLAKASTRDVLQVWSGLGYNRRAIYLKRCAEVLVTLSDYRRQSIAVDGSLRTESNSYWPQTEKELIKLPGIGKYTARAILCFAFNKQIAVVDTNVRRVIITRIQNAKGKSPNFTEKQIAEIAEQLLPKGGAYEWNQALMDYAAAVLKSHKIVIPKQSPFKTSNRFYRGQVIRLLLVQPETFLSLFSKIDNNGITQEKFKLILKQMEKDNLITMQGDTIGIA